MKTFLKILLASLLFLPATALATTAVPWSITNLTDGFIFPNLVNGSTKGILVSASSTFNGNLSVSTLTNGDCVQAGVGGILVSASSACGSGGSTPGGLNLQVQYNNAGAFGGISGAVTNGTILNLTNPLLGGATLTTSVVNGVTLTSAGSATSYLNGTGAYSVPVGTTYTGTFPIQVIGTVISSLFSTTTTFGLGNNSFLVTGPTGIPFVAASSTLNLPTSALASQNISQFTNNSGYLTANQTITLTGAVTGSGATAITTAFGAAGANTVLSNGTGATAVPTFIATSSLFQNASASATGLLTSTDWSTFNGKQAAGNYITALTGDVTASGPGSVAATLATVNSNVGTFTYPSVTVNGKGLVTAISNGTAPTTYTGTFPIAVTGSVISSLFSTTSNSGMAQGFQYVGSGGIFQSAASSSLFGFTPQPAGNYLTALTGDGTASGPGSATLTLATVNGNVGSFTNANITVNAKGLITAASNGTAGGVTSVTATYPLASSGGTTPNITTAFGTTTNNGIAAGSLYIGSGGIFQSTATGTISNGTGISVTAGQSVIGTGLTITNTGVTSNVAGTGISVSGSTGAVTITNSGVTSLTAGTGISLSGSTGNITVTNTGSTFGYPFTNPTEFGTTTAATTTPIWAQEGIFASSTSVIASTTFAINGNVGISTSSPSAQLTIASKTSADQTPSFVIDGATGSFNADMQLNRGSNTGTEEANIDFATAGTVNYQLGIQNNSTSDFELWDGSNDPVFTVKNGTNNIGFGTSTPFGYFAINADYGDVLPSNFILNVASSSLTGTTSLFSINNIGSTTLSTNFGACNTTNALTTNSSGTITCGAITGGTGAAYPFTPSTDNGINTSATSTPIQGTHPGLGLDVSATSWYGIGGQLLAYASSTNEVTIFGLGAGGSSAITNASASLDTTAIGFDALNINTGADNIGIGVGALSANTSGTTNIAVGTNSGLGNTTGTNNIFLGIRTGDSGTGAYQGDVNVGYQSGGENAGGIPLFTTALGYEAGFNSTGYDNTLVGGTAGLNLTSGFNNIALGFQTLFPIASGNNQLNIGNIIYGTLPATTTAFSLPTSGKIGVGTTTPFAKFAIQSNNGDTATTLFAIGSSTQTSTSTLFSIGNTGATSINTTSAAAFSINDLFGTNDFLFNTASTTGSIFTVAATTSPSLTSPIKLFDIDQYGGITASSTGSTPTLSCSPTNNGTLSLGSNDQTGTITSGTLSTSCTITFAHTKLSAPAVFVYGTLANLLSSQSTTAFTFTISATTGATLNYFVIQP